MSFPLRHISIPVPWHDTGWDGRLKRIAEERDDASEEAVAGKRLSELPQAKWPACVAERMGLMAPFEVVRMANHPYNRGPETRHGHFKETPLRHPAYSAAAVPFAWMLRENAAALSEDYEIDFRSEREPTKDDLGFKDGASGSCVGGT